jgi:hypothetical protein
VTSFVQCCKVMTTMTTPDPAVHLRLDGEPSEHKYNHQRTTMPFHLYRVFDRLDQLLYIGITTSMERRAKEHSSMKPWWKTEVAHIDTRVIGPRPIAQAMEAVVIDRERPKYNGLRGRSSTGKTLRAYMAAEGITVEDLMERYEADRATVESWREDLVSPELRAYRAERAAIKAARAA